MRLVLLFYIIKYSKDHIKCLKIKSKRKKQVLSYVLGWDVLVFSFLNFRGIFFCFNYFQITFFVRLRVSFVCLFFSLSSGVLTRKIKTGSS